MLKESTLMRAFRFTMDAEGGATYTNDPRDPGGPTKYGVALNFNLGTIPDKNGDGKITALDVRMLEEADALVIYRDRYWRPGKCDALPDALALAHADTLYNIGPGAAPASCNGPSMPAAWASPWTARSARPPSRPSALWRMTDGWATCCGHRPPSACTTTRRGRAGPSMAVAGRPAHSAVSTPAAPCWAVNDAWTAPAVRIGPGLLPAGLPPALAFVAGCGPAGRRGGAGGGPFPARERRHPCRRGPARPPARRRTTPRGGHTSCPGTSGTG